MSSKGDRKRTIAAYIIAVLIPVLFLVQAVQAHRYKKLQQEIKKLENKQVELVDQNRKLISEISVLSSSDRIEKISEEELGMHKARTEDIVRVDMTGEKKKN